MELTRPLTVHRKSIPIPCVISNNSFNSNPLFFFLGKCFLTLVAISILGIFIFTLLGKLLSCSTPHRYFVKRMVVFFFCFIYMDDFFFISLHLSNIILKIITNILISRIPLVVGGNNKVY